MSTVIGVGLQRKVIASILQDRRGPLIEEIGMQHQSPELLPEPVQVGKNAWQVYPLPPRKAQRGVGVTRSAGGMSKRKRKLQKQGRKANR